MLVLIWHGNDWDLLKNSPVDVLNVLIYTSLHLYNVVIVLIMAMVP